jgi:hypothetical protein
MTKQVSKERTGWRCEKISRRHREWGYNCPAVDLDFMVAEYNYGKPVALIEYKDKQAQPANVDHPTYKALIDLADGYKGGSLPCLIAVYCSENWWFNVYPLNDAAKNFYSHVIGKTISEQRFVRSLYLLRKKVLTDEDELFISKLNNITPKTNHEKNTTTAIQTARDHRADPRHDGNPPAFSAENGRSMGDD